MTRHRRAPAAPQPSEPRHRRARAAPQPSEPGASRRRAAGPARRLATGTEPPPLPGDVTVDTVVIDGEALVVFGLPATGAADRLTAAARLTPAERAVAELVLRGLSTAQIAAARRVAIATVSTQLQSIYRKLGVASRAELALKLD